MNKLLVQIVVFCFGTASASFGMTVEELLGNLNQVYTENSSFEYASTYMLFKDHKTPVVHSEYEGIMCRDAKNVYKKIKNTEFINTEGYTLKISHEEHLIQIGPAEKSVGADFDPKAALHNCTTKKLEDKGTYYLVTLEYRQATNSPFTKMVLEVSKKAFFLLQVDLYYRGAQNFSTDLSKPDLASPHLRIKCGDLVVKPSNSTQRFELASYLVSKGNTFIPAKEYADYKIIDNRIK